MPLKVNSLLEWTDPNGEQKVERVLDIDRSRDVAHVIQMDRSLPEAHDLSEVETGLATGRIRILTADPYAYLQRPDKSIPAEHRKRRDAAWAIIEPIVSAPNHQPFEPDARGRLIRAVIEKTGRSKKEIYRYLRRYWQAGMTPNALLPHFQLCGAPGKDRKAGAAKRGRPRRSAKLRGAPLGINIGPVEAEKLRQGYRMFYGKAPEDGGLPKSKAYERTLQKFFKKGFELRHGVMVPVLPPAEELPTYDQFIYWGSKASDFKETLMRRQGERKFNLRSRPVLGDSTLMAFGPGSLYQLDGTLVTTGS